MFSNWDSLSSDQTESSLYYHSIYNTKTWRQKWRQKWSPEEGKWEGRKDYVLVVYLNVVLVWREHSANVLRMPDKKNFIARASLHEHHRIVKHLLVTTNPTFINCAWLIITWVEMTSQIIQEIIWLWCFHHKWKVVPGITDMVPWISFIFDLVVVERRKARRADNFIMKINHSYKVLELRREFQNP